MYSFRWEVRGFVFSGWESLNNDFSLVKQLQCGLNHITGSQKPFWSVNSTNSKVSIGGSGLDIKAVMAEAAVELTSSLSENS